MRGLKLREGMLLLPLVLFVGGCFVEQDSIAISGDGGVSFDSTVTIEDAENKFEFSALENLASQAVQELRDGKWGVQQKWLSKTRPYKIQLTGSGKLSKVTPSTKFYALVRVNDKEYKIRFLTPSTEGKPSRRSIVFTKKDEGGADVVDAQGNPVSKIENVSESATYTIKLH